MNNPQNLLQLRVTDKKFVYDRGLSQNGANSQKRADSLTGVCVKLAGAMQSIKYFCPKSLSKIRPCPKPRRAIQKLSACNGQGGKVPYDRVSHPHFPKP